MKQSLVENNYMPVSTDIRRLSKAFRKHIKQNYIDDRETQKTFVMFAMELGFTQHEAINQIRTELEYVSTKKELKNDSATK